MRKPWSERIARPEGRVELAVIVRGCAEQLVADVIGEKAAQQRRQRVVPDDEGDRSFGTGELFVHAERFQRRRFEPAVGRGYRQSEEVRFDQRAGHGRQRGGAGSRSRPWRQGSAAGMARAAATGVSFAFSAMAPNMHGAERRPWDERPMARFSPPDRARRQRHGLGARGDAEFCVHAAQLIAHRALGASERGRDLRVGVTEPQVGEHFTFTRSERGGEVERRDRQQAAARAPRPRRSTASGQAHAGRTSSESRKPPPVRPSESEPTIEPRRVRQITAVDFPPCGRINRW